MITSAFAEAPTWRPALGETAASGSPRQRLTSKIVSIPGRYAAVLCQESLWDVVGLLWEENAVGFDGEVGWMVRTATGCDPFALPQTSDLGLLADPFLLDKRWVGLFGHRGAPMPSYVSTLLVFLPVDRSRILCSLVQVAHPPQQVACPVPCPRLCGAQRLRSGYCEGDHPRCWPVRPNRFWDLRIPRS